MTVVDTRDHEHDPDDRLDERDHAYYSDGRWADDDRFDDIDDVPYDDTDPDATTVGGEVELRADTLPDPWAPVPGRNGLERFATRPLPTLLTARKTAGWWTWALSRATLNLVTHAPQLGLYQIPHILRGLGTWASRYAQWRAQPEWWAAAQIAEPKDRAKEVARVRRRQIANTRLTILAVLAAFGAAVYLLRTGRGEWLLAALIVVIARADVVGRKEAPVTAPTVEIMPRSAFREGAPSHMVVADVHAVLTDQGYDPDRTAVVEPKVGEYGLSMTIHTPQEIREDLVDAIERGLQTFRGAVSILADPDNAALHELRVFWRDPLAFSVTPPRYEPNSLSIGRAAVMGYGVGNVPLELSFMRVNMIIVGSPGSGKSSTLWTAIDYLSACRDVVLLGIDLSGGPALHAWGDVFETRATDRDQAKALLEREIALCIERTKLLAARSEPRPGMPAPESENWTPADAAAGRGLFRIIIIDELPLLANDKELVALYAEHQRIGRKAGQTSVAATQDLSGETLGATSLRKYPSTIVLHACSREDVTTALGKGAVAQGWAPHRLTPAEGEVANDAGKAFVKSGRHNRPVPWRMARMELGEIHSRAMERIEAGRPVDVAAADVVVEGAVVPPLLAAVSSVFDAAGSPEFLPTEDLLAALIDLGFDRLDAVKLSAQLGEIRPVPVEPGRKRIDGEPRRGYFHARVRAALDAL